MLLLEAQVAIAASYTQGVASTGSDKKAMRAATKLLDKASKAHKRAVSSAGRSPWQDFNVAPDNNPPKHFPRQKVAWS